TNYTPMTTSNKPNTENNWVERKMREFDETLCCYYQVCDEEGRDIEGEVTWVLKDVADPKPIRCFLRQALLETEQRAYERCLELVGDYRDEDRELEGIDFLTKGYNLAKDEIRQAITNHMKEMK